MGMEPQMVAMASDTANCNVKSLDADVPDLARDTTDTPTARAMGTAKVLSEPTGWDLDVQKFSHAPLP